MPAEAGAFSELPARLNKPWPHLHSFVAPTPKAGTYKLTFYSVGPAEQSIAFLSYGSLDEIEATAHRVLSDIAEERRRIAVREAVESAV